MSNALRDRTLALAGIFQAAYQVQQLARHGTLDNEQLEIAVHSILNMTPTSAEAVYGGADRLRTGLEQLQRVLVKQQGPAEQELMRYVVALLILERQSAKRPAMLEEMGRGIRRAQAQAEHFSATHGNVIANLAGIYSDTISTLTPRIMVSGDPAYLSNPDNANRIRALLLAGIRSAVLWRQRGGSHWRLLFRRGALAREAQHILDGVSPRSS
ncbi:MAG: high frequency lysogenization protein HflD [Pseudomonadota bacterium]